MTAIHPVYWTRRGLDDAALELLGLGRYAILATENPVIPPRSVSDGQPVRSGSAHLLPEGGRAVGEDRLVGDEQSGSINKRVGGDEPVERVSCPGQVERVRHNGGATAQPTRRDRAPGPARPGRRWPRA